MATQNWNGGNAAPEPHTLYDRGYDVSTTRLQAHEGGANAYLADETDGTHILLTLVAIETSLSLAGSRSQSPLQADFYARNFNQPSFTMMTQTRSQYEVGRISEFVHKAQRNAVAQGGLMRMTIPSGGLNNVRATSAGKDGMKGVRRGISMSGYVATVPRSHKRHDPAPKFQFDFIVAKMNTGIFEDQPYRVYKLAKWSEIVESQLEGNFIKPPMTQEQEEQAEVVRESARQGLGDMWLGDLLGGGG